MSAPIRLHALLLADRIDTRGLARADEDTGVDPVAMRIGESGRAFVFRQGVAAYTGLDPGQVKALLETLGPRMQRPLATPVMEDADLVVRESGDESGLPEGVIAVRGLDLPRLAVVADVLAKAVVLNRVEETINAALDRAEPMAEALARTGRPGVRLTELNQRMGEALLVQHRMIGRAAVAEKPEILWDHPELERLYARLAAEYELIERADDVERKLALLRATAETTGDLIQNGISQRLEWIIILLIAFEIALSLYTMATNQSH